MPVFRLDEQMVFPPPEAAAEGGLLAVGGDLSPERVLLAYAQGIFPWYAEGLPILWHSPDPRAVLPIGAFRPSRSLRKAARRFEVTFDRAFGEVIDACAQVPREGQEGTWITLEMREAYLELHRLGYAHSVEVWREGRVRGGLYGLSLGAAFFGESMFHLERDASKVAFAALVERLSRWDFAFIDGQVVNDHLLNLGFQVWPRSRFLAALHDSLAAPTRQGSWATPG